MDLAILETVQVGAAWPVDRVADIVCHSPTPNNDMKSVKETNSNEEGKKKHTLDDMPIE